MLNLNKFFKLAKIVHLIQVWHTYLISSVDCHLDLISELVSCFKPRTVLQYWSPVEQLKNGFEPFRK